MQSEFRVRETASSRTRGFRIVRLDVDNHRRAADNQRGAMTQSVEQVVKRFEKAAARLRREHRDPQKAREFLIRAGIAVKSKSSPSGIRLAKRFR
jgi:hypothetical protein